MKFQVSGLLRMLAAKVCLCSMLLPLASMPVSHAAEETGYAWPLGPIGGKFRIWTGESYIRVSEVTAGAPGAAAGLQVGDFITGAFGQSFDPISGSKFDGVVRQLSASIDYAETNNLVLPLSISRPGVGALTLNVTLPATDGLGPAYTLTSSRFSATYETACAALHTRVMATSNGDIGYPTGFAGLALLGHPNWNDTTGAKPYRLSINKIRDWAISYINGAILTPVESKLFDGTNNPNYVDSGLENWTLGQAVMFISEYITKTGEFTTYQSTLQRGATLMANRIQNWVQPNNGGTGDRSYDTCKGTTGHGGVVGDYTHAWYVGINMAGVHLFNGLAMAKRAGADMTARPKDGHYFGYTFNPGDTIPDNISPVLPASIVLPRGAQDTDPNNPNLDNVSNAPLTKVNNPFFYDCSLDQKFWLQWDNLVRSTAAEGFVNYAPVTWSSYDAGGRTPASLFAFLTYNGGNALSTADQDVTTRQMNYIVTAHDIHLNAHAYNMGGACFTALLMPHMGDREQRYFLDNWKFFYNLARQPDGSIQYFRGRDFTDNYINETDAMHTDIALAGSVARGGLPHVPGFTTNRVMARVRQPLMDWPTKDARRLRLPAGVNSTSFDLDLMSGTGSVIDPSSVTASWSVVSGPVTSGILASPGSLDTVATFPQAGTYRLRLDASSGGLSTYELVDVVVQATPIAGYVMGQADYKVYTGLGGSTVPDLTSAAKFPNSPDLSSNLTQLVGTYSGDNYGSTITCVVIPPVTGAYRFYIASDDNSQLLFNSGGPSATGAATIASVSSWTNALQWNKYSSQQSAVINLTAGQPYYLQARQKEGGGGDNLAVAWTTPTNSTITVIGTENIARDDSANVPAIASQPANVTTTLGSTVNLSFTVTGPTPRLFQWRRNGVNYGSITNTPTLSIANAGAGIAGTWDCVYTSGTSVLTTQSATVSFSDAGVLTSGGLWKEFYAGISGGSISDLTSSPDYLINTTSSGPLAQPSTGDQGDSYGQRWTGWVIPTVTGSYRFLATGDDAFQLYLSPDQYQSHRTSIISSSGKADMVWSSAATSAYFPLVAGQRYFVELLHKEATGGDHAAFTWQMQGDALPTSGAVGLISSANLQYATGGTRPDAATAPPLAIDDVFAIAGGASFDLTVLANDVDASVSSLSITGVTQPTIGSLAISADGKKLVHTSAAGEYGTTTATYTVTNAVGQSATANVSISIGGERWITDANGNWTTGTNWFSGAAPANSGASLANFSTVNLTLDRTVTLDAAVTVGGLLFGDTNTTSAAGWILSGNTLTLAGTAPSIGVGSLGTGKVVTINSTLAGTGGLIKNGAGQLTVSNGGNGGLTGALTVNSGLLVFNTTANYVDAFGKSGVVTVNAGAELRVTGGINSITRNTSDAAFVLNGGTFDYQGSTHGHMGNITLSNGATWKASAGGGYSGENMQLNGDVTVANTGGNTAASNLSNFSQGIGLNGIRTFNVSDVTASSAADLIVSAELEDRDSGANGLIKTGAGTMLVNKAALYTGTTTVNAGTLLVTNTTGSATGTGAVTVASAGTLAGNGIITGTVANNGSLAPGNLGVGNLTISNTLTAAPGSSVAWEIADWNGAAGTGSDKITANSLNVTATSASPVTVRLAAASLVNFTETSKTFTLVQTTSGITGFAADKFVVNTSALTTPAGSWTVQQSGNNLVLVYTRFNTTPVFATDPIQLAAVEDGIFSGQLVAVDPDLGESLTFSKVSGPAWLSVAAGGALSGVPSNADVGANNFSVRVTDSMGASVNATLVIAVANTNDAPVFVADPINLNATEDAVFSGQLAATDVDAGDSLTFSKISGPAWLSVSPSGALSGTPTNSEVGTNGFVVRVTDAQGVFVNAALNVTVANTNDAPVFTADPINLAATEDSIFTGQLSATDVDAGDTLTFSKVSGPAWLSVSASGALSGTPTNSEVGANAFVVRATDAQGTSTNATLNVTVANTNDAPVFTVDPINLAATEDSAFNGQLAATDVDAGDALTFSKVSGPAWLSVSTSGALTGTPTNSEVGANAFVVRVTDAQGVSANAALNVTVANTNDAPVFAADPINLAATEDSAFTAQLSATDVDAGATLTFSKVSGPSWLSVSATGALSGTPLYANVGVNNFTVQVSDGTANVTASLVVTVASTNNAPVFAADPFGKGDATVGVAYAGQTLAGSATDADAGDVLVFSKVSGPSWLNVAADGTLSGTPGGANTGTNTFSVKATDNDGASATATMTILVNPRQLAWWNFNEGTGVTASDASGNANHATLMGATWAMPRDGHAAIATNGTGTQKAQAASLDTTGAMTIAAWIKPAALSGHRVLVSEKNSYVFKTNGTGLLFTTPGILDHYSSGVTLTANQWTHVAVTFVPSTTGGVKFFVNGVLASTGNASAMNQSTEPTTIGDTTNWTGQSYNGALDDVRIYQGALTATQIAGIYNAYPAQPSPEAPVFAADPFTGAGATEDAAYTSTLAGSATDNDVIDSLTYSKVSGPAWLTVAANGTLGGTPGNADVGDNAFTVRVTDSYGLSDDAVMHVAVANTNDAPVFAADPINLNATEDLALTGQLAATDVDAGDSLTFSKVSGPAWLTVSASGALGGTPTNSEVGDNTFVVRVTDALGVSADATLNIAVANTNDAPVFAADPVNLNATEDAAFGGLLVAADVDAGDTLTFSKVSGPAWLSVSPAGALAGTPGNSEVGINAFVVRVTDAQGASVDAVLNIAVANTNDAPAFVANPINLNAIEDLALTGQLAATDVDAGDTLTFSKVSGPAWLTVSTSGALGGTPTNSEVGANTFVVRVTDALGVSADATLNVTVANANDAPVFVSNPINLNATEDTALTGQLAATDVDAGDTLSFSKVSGPAWLTVSTSGALGGTPTNSEVGANAFVVRVTDAQGASANATLNVTVANVNDAPVFAANPITKAGAVEGVAYTGQSLAGSASDPDTGDTVTYSKVSGPTWLTVAADGTLGGTPAAGTAGLNAFVVRATDGSGSTADATLNITVASGLPSPWLTGDVGTTGLVGSATYTGGAYTVAGAGLIGGSTTDAERFVYQTLSGDGSIVARVSTLGATGSTNARIGVQIRETLASNSKALTLAVTGGGSYKWMRRTTDGGATSNTNSSSGTAPNIWIKLARVGNVITASKSTNGTSWTTIGSVTVTLATNCYIGLAVGSGSTTSTNTSVFDNVTAVP